jgi:murein DD-endopeptidase MepM/ murein hydrolase activator NlpD
VQHRPKTKNVGTLPPLSSLNFLTIRDGNANCPPAGYQNSNQSPFIVNGNYIGARCTTDHSPKTFLNYDGHSGYDYPFPKDTTVIFAPADGRLYKAKVDSVNDRRACTSSSPAITGWDAWHSFYLVHGTTGQSPADFVSSGYSSWYLHVDALSATIENELLSSDFATVKKGDAIAVVGCYGPTISGGLCSKTHQHQCGNINGFKLSPHLHFEVRRGLADGRHSDVVDPYASGIWTVP